LITSFIRRPFFKGFFSTAALIVPIKFSSGINFQLLFGFNLRNVDQGAEAAFLMPVKNFVVHRKFVINGTHSIDKARGVPVAVHPRLSADPIPPIFNMEFGPCPLGILEMG
jgi:hypothetical protein